MSNAKFRVIRRDQIWEIDALWKGTDRMFSLSQIGQGVLERLGTCWAAFHAFLAYYNAKLDVALIADD